MIKKYNFKAQIQNVEAATDAVCSFLNEAAISSIDKKKVRVAIDEIFSNISYYAFPDKIGNVSLICDWNKDSKDFTLTFVDKGVPFNPLAKSDPDTTLSAEKRKIGGLGIYLVRNLAKDMSYEYLKKSNILNVVFH